jgi:hypothetical protein
VKLADLDEKYVGQAAERIGRAVRGLTQGRQRAASSLDVTSLSTLDSRFATKGPLAMVRDVPQLGFVAIAGLLFAASVAVLDQTSAQNRESARRSTADQQVVAPTGGGIVLAGRSSLGPDVGDKTNAYRNSAIVSLREASKTIGARVALVSLTNYLTPAQAATTFTGVGVTRVYLRARAAGAEAVQLPVDIKGPLLGDLTKQYAALVPIRRAAEKSYQGYVDTLTVTTKEEASFKDLYAQFARSSAIEAQAYATGCACVFAVVVSATPDQLLALATEQGVRAVEVAGAKLSTADLEIRPLLPEIHGVVPKQQAQPESAG